MAGTRNCAKFTLSVVIQVVLSSWFERFLTVAGQVAGRISNATRWQLIRQLPRTTHLTAPGPEKRLHVP